MVFLCNNSVDVILKTKQDLVLNVYRFIPFYMHLENECCWRASVCSLSVNWMIHSVDKKNPISNTFKMITWVAEIICIFLAPASFVFHFVSFSLTVALICYPSKMFTPTAYFLLYHSFWSTPYNQFHNATGFLSAQTFVPLFSCALLQNHLKMFCPWSHQVNSVVFYWWNNQPFIGFPLNPLFPSYFTLYKVRGQLSHNK